MHSCASPNPLCFKCQLNEDEVREFYEVDTDYQEG